jgi:hypothetical protein
MLEPANIKIREGIKKSLIGMTTMKIMKEKEKKGSIKKDPGMTPSIMKKNT